MQAEQKALVPARMTVGIGRDRPHLEPHCIAMGSPCSSAVMLRGYGPDRAATCHIQAAVFTTCADNDPVDSSARTARPNSSAFHYGPGHMIMHGNQAFLDEFGPGCVGQPAREVMLDLPAEAFDLMDLVYREGRPFARRIATPGGERRLVVAPRRDPENGETYGVVSHLRPASEPSARSI